MPQKPPKMERLALWSKSTSANRRTRTPTVAPTILEGAIAPCDSTRSLKRLTAPRATRRTFFIRNAEFCSL